MAFLDNGMPVDDLWADEIADNFEVGDKVFIAPYGDMLREQGIVTESGRLENFVRVKGDMSDERYYRRSKVNKII